jgi:hypothetical protein
VGRRDLPARPRFGDEPVEDGPALGVRQRHGVAAVDPEHVEQHVGDGHLAHALAHLDLVGQVHAALEVPEAGPARFVEGDDLAVEDGRVTGECVGQRVDLRVAIGDVVEIAALDVHVPVADVGDGAHPVPFDFVGEGGVVPRQRARRGQHRDDPLRHRVVRDG